MFACMIASIHAVVTERTKNVSIGRLLYSSEHRSDCPFEWQVGMVPSLTIPLGYPDPKPSSRFRSVFWRVRFRFG